MFLFKIFQISFLLSICLLFSQGVQAKSLEQELQELSASFNAPDSMKKIMQDDLDRLKNSGILEKFPKVGEKLPEGKFLDKDGNKIKLSSLANKPTIIAFYRGGWCPYCNIQLRAFQRRLSEINRHGQLVAISPQTPDDSLSTSQKNDLEFIVLSDPKNKFAKKLGIVFELEGELKELYQKFGIDLKKNQGNGKWELPLAATFVIDKDRVVRYVFKDVDYKKRANIDELIQALRDLK